MGIMLPGASDAVAAADLQERVQKMAVSAGVKFDRCGDAARHRRLGVGIRFRCGSA